MNKPKNYFIAALAGFLFLGTLQYSFGQISFTNGGFTSGETSTGGQVGYNVTLTSWSSSGYIFTWASGETGDVGVPGEYGTFSLWGAAHGADPGNGGVDVLTLPPGGGNFIASDGAAGVDLFTQVITGLTSGTKYNVTFEWAAAQQSGFTGSTTESWSVGLGNSSDITYTQNSGDTAGTLVGTGATPTNSVNTTSTVDNISHGFTGWMSQTFTFTANATSDTLYFFANGTPTGEPPFLLLADVNVAVPEPKTTACWTMVFAMLILGGNRTWRWYRKRLATTA